MAICALAAAVPANAGCASSVIASGTVAPPAGGTKPIVGVLETGPTASAAMPTLAFPAGSITL